MHNIEREKENRLRNAVSVASELIIGLL